MLYSIILIKSVNLFRFESNGNNHPSSMMGIIDHTAQMLKNEISEEDAATASVIIIERQRRHLMNQQQW